MNTILKTLLYIILMLLFAGCANSGRSNSGLSQIITKPNISQPIVAEGLLNMPKDAAKIILAVGAKIVKSNRKITDVILQAPFNSELIDARVFSFSNAILNSYKRNNKHGKLNADIFLKDSIGRKTIYNINLSYESKNSKLFISNLNITDKFIDASDSVCFILPAKKYLELNKNIPKNFYQLYRFAAINAITPKQVSSYNNKSDWAIMVFVLNRVSKSATITLGVSGNIDSHSKGDTSATKYINYDGWRVGIIAANFHLLKAGGIKKLYAKVVFKAGDKNKENILSKYGKVIGLYRIE